MRVCISLLFLAFFFSECKKDTLLNDPSAKLNFSVDTLTFDTVFTTIGSATRLFKIYNPHKKKLSISSIFLTGGNSSSFRMNVDGISGHTIKNITILPEDSLYVFIEVTVDPNNGFLPLVIYDSVNFITNGNQQRVILEAWGQDAHFYKDSVICNETWVSDKPYVIINSILIDSGCSLTIQEGTKVYCSSNSGIFVLGTLIVNGSQLDSVVFQGMRLESFYQDLPGQWLGIFPLRGSTNNEINHTVIKNSIYGISVGSNSNPDLTSFTQLNAPDIFLRNTIIRNSLSTGIFGFFSFIQAENCLIYNCGQYNVQLAMGGIYGFRHCTFVNYASSLTNHKDPIIQVSNFAETPSQHVSVDLLAAFENCIIYGSNEEELSLDDDGSGANFDCIFDHTLLRTKLNTSNPTYYVNILKNADPKFIDLSENDFHLQSGSPCINMGKTLTIPVTEDLEGNMRPLGSAPDLGVYEKE